jgi:hypothetical protein
LASTSYVQTLHGVSLGESIEMTDAAEIAAYIKDGESTLVIGSMDVNFPDPPTLDWYLVTEAGVLEAPHAGSSAQIEEERRIRYLLSGIPFPARWNERIASQLARYDQPAGARTLYLGLPRRASYSQSPEGFDEFFQQMTRAESIDRVIVVTSTLPSASYPLEYVSPSFDKAGFKHGDGEVFEKRHTRIDVYDK